MTEEKKENLDPQKYSTFDSEGKPDTKFVSNLTSSKPSANISTKLSIERTRRSKTQHKNKLSIIPILNLDRVDPVDTEKYQNDPTYITSTERTLK